MTFFGFFLCFLRSKWGIWYIALMSLPLSLHSTPLAGSDFLVTILFCTFMSHSIVLHSCTLFFYLIVTSWILFLYLFCNDTCHKMHLQWVDVFHHLVPDPLYYAVKWKKTNIFLFEDPVVAKSWLKTIISWYLTIGFIKQDFVKENGGGGGANQNFPHKEGVEAKRGGLNDFVFWWGGFGQKERGDFFKGGFMPWCPLCVKLQKIKIAIFYFLEKESSKFISSAFHLIIPHNISISFRVLF